MEKLTIWQVYHDDLQKYNLLENKCPYYKSFNTTHTILHDLNINEYQHYINEFVCQYYVYKNHIKSHLVGFCHYNKVFSDYFTFKYVNEKYLTYNHNIKNICFDNYIMGLDVYRDASLILNYKNQKNNVYNKISNFLQHSYPDLYNKLITINENDYKKCIRFECFICKWDDFQKYMEFMLNFFEFYNVNLNNIKESDLDLFVIDYYENKKALWYIRQYNRRMAFFIEFLCSVYWMLQDKDVMYNYILK
jgi:hypothetical protein